MEETIRVKARVKHPGIEYAQEGHPVVPQSLLAIPETQEERLGNLSTTFSGADSIIILNGVVLGEITDMEYEEDLDSFNFHRIKGFVESILFSGGQPSIRKALRKSLNGAHHFVIYFATEYGTKMLLRFENVRFTTRKGGLKIDAVVQSDKYYFEASDTTYHTDFTINFLGENGVEITYATV